MTAEDPGKIVCEPMMRSVAPDVVTSEGTGVFAGVREDVAPFTTTTPLIVAAPPPPGVSVCDEFGSTTGWVLEVPGSAEAELDGV